MNKDTVLALALAAFMAFMGAQKFIADVPIFLIIEQNISINYGVDLPFIDPALKYFTGVSELAAALILVLGRRFSGALLSSLIIAGAILAHLTVLGVSTPVSSDPGAEHSPVLFLIALASFPLALSVLLTNRKA